VVGSAHADWDTPVTLSPPGIDALTPDVGVDANGNSLFVWYQDDGTWWRVMARARSSAGAVGPLLALTPAVNSSAHEPNVAVSSGGDAVFAWVRASDEITRRVEIRARSAAGLLANTQRMSSSDGDFRELQLDIADNGDAIAAWVRRANSTEFDSAIEARVRLANGTLRGLRTLSPPCDCTIACDCAEFPALDVSPSGNGFLVWLQRLSEFEYIVRGRGCTAGGVFGGVQTLTSVNSGAPDVAVDDTGNALVVWSRGGPTTSYIQARSRSVGGQLGPIQTIANGAVSRPAVAVNADGDAVIVWRRIVSGNEIIQGRTRSAAGVLGAVRTFSTPGDDTSEPRVEIDDSGNALVVWSHDEGANFRAKSRTLLNTGVLRPVQLLSAAGQDAFLPAVALDADGDAVATWMRSDGNVLRVETARGP
jgi:hypothetical protein